MKPAHCTEIGARLPYARMLLRLLLLTLSLSHTSISLAQVEPDTTQEQPAGESPTQEAEAAKPAPAPPAPPPYSSREERDMKLLAGELRDQETAVWLDAIDGPFLALYEKEIGTEPVGAVLILHAEGQHGNWPTTIQTIRNRLPYHGWITLATSLPNPDSPGIPKRTLPARSPLAPPSDATDENPETTANSSDAEEPATTDEANEIFDENTQQVTDGSLAQETTNDQNTNTPDTADPTNTDRPQLATEDIAFSRLEAAITYLNDQGIFNVVLLGDGLGAARAGNFLQTLPAPESNNPNEDPIKPVRAMVIINARNHSPVGDIKLIDSLYDPEMPILDIYFGQDQRDKIESQARKKYALRNGFQTYQQILLPELAHNTMLDSNRLTRRVRGFLNSHARGVKVDNAVVNKR